MELIDIEKPDLVLLDVRMEEMTGIEVLRALRGKNNDVKVIMVTGGTGLVGKAIEEVANNPVHGYKKDDEKWIFLSSKDADLRYPYNNYYLLMVLLEMLLLLKIFLIVSNQHTLFI